MKNRFKEHSSSLSLERNIVEDLFTLKEFKSQEIDELHSRIPNEPSDGLAEALFLSLKSPKRMIEVADVWKR